MTHTLTWRTTPLSGCYSGLGIGADDGIVVTAREILQLLARKHAEDVFVPECKTGPTQFTSTTAMRLDAWVMPRSWAHWETVGYEIKVSRGDFLRDEKWKAYLDYCHKFYFVAPPGIIEKEELPDGIGLMVTSKNGTRLYIKRLAAAREVDIPIALLIYVLMCRTEVRGEWNPDLSRAEFWKNWLETKGDLKEIGWRASKRIGEMINHEIVLARTTNERLQTENENLRQVEDFCERNKIPLGYSVEYRLAQMMENANGAEIISDIDRTIETLESLKSRVRPATKP